jgi:hypothetical protein
MAAVFRRGIARFGLACTVGTALALSGCAAGSGSGDPGSKALANGESCGSIKQQLSKLDSKGVPGYIQAQAAGRKISAAQKADADLYNQLLNDYLGARCHV